MSEIAIAAIVCLPLYVLVRLPFRRLPLHIDTGFYVSNHTVATGRFKFARGWNAHYAGCSKVVPEFFYTCVYLLHGRRHRDGSWRYKEWSRFYAALFNYSTAMLVGLIAYALSGDNATLFVTGLVAYGLVSSEPHWGGYFENGELFENAATVLSLFLLITGLLRGELEWFGYAAFAWAFAAFFIKLSAAIGFAILFGGVSFLYPTTIIPIVLGGAAAGGLFVVWVMLTGKNPISLFHALLGHERSYNQWVGWHGLFHRFAEKLRCLGNAIWRNPLIPALAIVGAIFASPSEPVFWLYATAVTVTYFAQATDCRYYLLPIAPAVAMLAGAGAAVVMSLGPAGLLNATGLVVIWLIANPVRAMCYSTSHLNEWCWKGGISDVAAIRNMLLDAAAAKIRRICAGRPMLVYGPLNQAYVLAGSSWETPVVAPEFYLDHVAPGWQLEFNKRLLQSPPTWILDTGSCFDARSARTGLGLDYVCKHRVGSSLRLFRLEEVSEHAIDPVTVETFRQQTQAEAFVEEARCGDEFTVHDLDYDMADEGLDSLHADPTAAALAELLADLARRGYRKLAVYGAGRFTQQHADVYKQAAAPVAVVLDDNAELDGKKCLDWPVRSPESVSASDFDAIIISTDRFARAMLARIRKRFGDDLPAFTIKT